MSHPGPPGNQDPAELLGLPGPLLATTTDPGWVQIALDHLRRGWVVALPTETVYGLAVALDSPAGVERVRALKVRAIEKALPWQLPDLLSALGQGFRLSPGALRLAGRFWPGPLTLILEKPASCPPWFAPDSPTVALRIPDHAAALALLRAWAAPLAVTSANASGAPECLDANSVLWAFADRSELLVVDGGPVPGGLASTVVDAVGPEPVVLREGPVHFQSVLEVWHGS